MKRVGLTALAHLHRPREGTVASLHDVLPLALKWGSAQPTHVQHLWHAGFDKIGQQVLLSAIHAQKITLPVLGEHAVDRLIGDAGVAADWLVLACAAEFAPAFGGAQLVARHSGANSMAMIVQPILRSSVQTRL